MSAKAIYRRTMYGPALDKIEHTLCEDGKRRTAFITGEPDTVFSVPARVNYKGKQIRGFITGRENENGEQDYEFIAYSYLKNGHLKKGDE